MGKQTEDHNVQHKCMGPNTNTYGFPPNPEECWAIRAEITFPSCWNGDYGTEGDQLIYSYNDWTGYGFHGDFLMGWNEGVIESMIDYCMTHEDGMATQCNNDKSGPPHCPWEGSVD